MDIGYVNRKPGTAKTTCAVWTACALDELGYEVWLIDCDPAASTLRWSDLAGGFEFGLAGLPTRDVHRRAVEYGGPEAVRIYDTPAMEDHAGVVRSVLRQVDEVIVPVAPSPIEIERMAPVRDEVRDLDAVRRELPRLSVLLNRVVRSASSGPYWRGLLAEDGYEVLSNEIPNWQAFSQSFGESVKPWATPYQTLAEELMTRGYREVGP